MTAPAAGMWMEPDGVRGGAAQWASAADDLESAGSALQHVVAAVGPCWGADAAGRQFAEDYLSAAEETVRAFGQLTQALRSVRRNLAGVADSTQGTDETNARNLSTQER